MLLKKFIMRQKKREEKEYHSFAFAEKGDRKRGTLMVKNKWKGYCWVWTELNLA
ncbi:hypothetical protein IC582_026244 [Cucumis melo]